MTTTTVVNDPVCGMDIDPATADRRTEHKGQTYYFCGATCKEKFDANPEQYVNQPAAAPQSDGCCS
jgi:Cu+-exporting ATPase